MALPGVYSLAARNHVQCSRRCGSKRTPSSLHFAVIEIYTVGYEAFNSATFSDLLSRSGVEKVVDVRQMPISRKKGFAKNGLKSTLEAAGIDYTHVGAFGCPREIRNEYRETGDWAQYTVKFKAYIKTRHPELMELGELASQTKCALPCLEEDYNFCHRTYVAEELAEATNTPVTMRHLTGPIKNRTRIVSPRLMAASA